MNSVALCVYGDIQFLDSQLVSILEDQDFPVDEVIIGDDGIFVDYDFGSDPRINLLNNETRLGCVRNFENVLKQCKGDLIFLSDQDDEWKCKKVQKIVEWFEQNPNKDVVFTDALIIDAERVEGKATLWQSIGFDPNCFKGEEEQIVESLLRGNFVTGATVVLRKKALQYLLPFPKGIDGLVYHDHWIAVCAASAGKLGCLEQKLINYRIHSDQTAGAPIKSFYKIIFRKRHVFFSSVKSHRMNLIFYSQVWTNLYREIEVRCELKAQTEQVFKDYLEFLTGRREWFVSELRKGGYRRFTKNGWILFLLDVWMGLFRGVGRW